MSPLITALVTFLCISVGAVLGSIFRGAVPEHHVRDDSKDALKLCVGLIATLTALVLGLLVSSAKSSFDSLNAGLTQSSAKIIMLDRALAQYGTETCESRALLRRTTASLLHRNWPEEATTPAILEPIDPLAGLEQIHKQVIALASQDDSQRCAQSQSLQLSNDLLQSRWQLIEQAHAALPPVFLIMVVCWMTVLFAGFGLLAPRNVTVMVVLLACAVSASGAVLLILEMNHPFGGLIKLSSAALRYAMSQLG